MTQPRGPQPFTGQEKRLRLLAFVRQDTVVRVDKRVEDTAMVWPHLLVIEFIAAMIWMLGLFIISALFNAPLQDHSTLDCTPNPSKAPWYLLNLQELLLHMDKGLAGMIVPTIWLTFMAAIPYIDRSREGIGHWFTNEVGKKCAIFAAVFTGVLVPALIAFDAIIKVDRRVLDPVTGVKTGWAGYSDFALRYFPGGSELIPNYVIPIFTMLALPVVLVLLCKRLFGANTREWMIAIWTGFVVTYLVLTVVGTSMRGPGMDLYAPWSLPETHQCFEPAP
ncbi:MAG: menaquinol-cytochrome C reductase [Candidatus Limnocylindria bacterium]|nr:menaquinol-cytochrome C reductase [Candidatus Limnocylindria bacterium]